MVNRNGLFTKTSSLAKLMVDWSVGDPTDHMELQGADVAVDMAKLTLTVIAGVNIIEEFSKSPDAKSMAQRVLRTSA